MVNKIQLLSENFKENINNITVSTLNQYKAFNSFDFNIIDLNKECLWEYDDIKEEYKKQNLLESLKDSIEHSNTKTKFIFLIPQNMKINMGRYNTDYLNNNRYLVTNCIYAFSGITISLILGKSVTKIDEKEFNADFYFNQNHSTEVLASNVNSDATIIQKNNFIITTINITKIDSLNILISKIIEFNKNSEAPSWINEIEFFRDNDQLNLIEMHESQIKKLESKILNSKKILDENDKFKSILYAKDQALVDVVFKMLEEMLNCDLSNFEDVYDEDFFIEKDDVSFIGEIKGVKSNAKNQHLSQLNDHAEKKLAQFKKKGININLKQILIINTFKEKHPQNRPEIEEETIMKAKNMYSSLIIKTTDLLKLFEMYKKEEINSENIIKHFKEDIGLFELSNMV